MRHAALALALLTAAPLAPFAVQPVQAADIRTERVRFAAGADGAVVKGEIAGDRIVDYVLGAEAGQHAVITLQSDNASAYFNILAPGETETAFFIGSVQGTSFEGDLPASGDYTIRVYLMRNAARRDEKASYRLDIRIAAADLSKPVQADFADGLQGGPDFWEVSGVSSTLNIRAEPSTGAAIAGRVPPGTVLRNRGCRMNEGRRWCKVEDPDDASVTGWAAGDFLRESAGPVRGPSAPTVSPAPADAQAPGASAEPAEKPGASAEPAAEQSESAEPAAKPAESAGAAERAGQGDFDATGMIPCKQVAGQPTSQCQMGVARGAPGEATVVVTRPDGTTRALFFEDGRFVGADTSQADGYPDTAATREADMTIVTVGEERYEVPDAVIYGG